MPYAAKKALALNPFGASTLAKCFSALDRIVSAPTPATRHALRSNL